jgi:hypothetical protein
VVLLSYLHPTLIVQTLQRPKSLCGLVQVPTPQEVRVVTSLHSLAMQLEVSRRNQIALFPNPLDLFTAKSMTRILPLLGIASGGLRGVGGSLYLGAGQATGIGSTGGSIDLVAGSSTSKGGHVQVMSGSGEVTSGKIAIESNAAMVDSTSGDVFISSGSSDGRKMSGTGKISFLSIFSNKSTVDVVLLYFPQL